jgi:hypothetical protein
LNRGRSASRRAARAARLSSFLTSVGFLHRPGAARCGRL